VFLDAVYKKKITATGAASGAVVGLVAITPAAGFVHAPSSLAIGGIGVLVVYIVLEVKAKVFPHYFPQLDDSLDVFSCHGIGGATGSILTGFFASKEANPAGADGVFFGNPILLGYQFAAVTITMFFSCLATAVILLILKYTIGLVAEDEDNQGLDIILHGNKAYVYDEEVSLQIQSDGGDVRLTELKNEEISTNLQPRNSSEMKNSGLRREASENKSELKREGSRLKREHSKKEHSSLKREHSHRKSEEEKRSKKRESDEEDDEEEEEAGEKTNGKKHHSNRE